MKAFWCSLILFGVLLVVIAYNAVYISHTVTTLGEQINALPPCDAPGAIDAATVLRDKWTKEKDYISLSVSYDELHAMDDILTELLAAAESNNGEEYEKNRRLAAMEMRHIQRLENFSLENLL